MKNIFEKLPEIGTKLDDMTFEQIKAIAVAGKTTEYGIIVGRQIKINDDLKAEIVNIGDDYIELLTTTPVLSAMPNDNKIFLANNKKVLFNVKSSFYKMPQVNYKDKQSQQICFVGSCVQKELLKWFDEQSEDFKSVIKGVKREYDVATLEYKNKYKQANKSTKEELECVYIPTIDEVIFIFDNSVTWDYIETFWTSTPCNISTRNNNCAFGYFFGYGRGHSVRNYGNKSYNVLAMFRIG